MPSRSDGDGGLVGERMGRLKRAVTDEWRRWRGLLRLLRGRGIGEDSIVDPPQMDPSCHKGVVDEMAADTDRRSREAEAALSRIRHSYHEANQPYTVARVKVSMLRRIEG